MMLELEEKRVLVLGLGLSGRSAAAFCADHGAHVTASDERAAEDLSGLDELEGRVELRLSQPFPDPSEFDLIVPSPGVPTNRFADCGRPIWGDIELFYRACPVPIVAVTGTNGKSTVTLLIHALLRAAGLRSEAAGNIGKPVLELAGTALDAAVLEVSSFQLDTIDRFQPRVAVLLNISPDHLDRHGSFEAYVAAKARLLEQLSSEDFAILNSDDAQVAALAEKTSGRVLWFSLKRAVENGAWFDAGSIVLRDGEEITRFSLDGMPLTGLHNLENILAALLAATAMGADPKRALRGLPEFRGLPHRTEFVAQIDGITFINDSKATNPGAAVRALESVLEPVIWIAGGKDKDLDFDALAKTAQARVRSAILIGEAADKLAAALGDRVDIQRAHSLEAAVQMAAKIANEGDVVLLSPACASFDQFKSFEDRGDQFRAAVERLKTEGIR